MRIQKLRFIVSGLVLAASIGTFSAFAHETEGEGHGMMSGGMMQMMSEMSPEERKAMTKACMNMMQAMDATEQGQPADKPKAEAKQ